MELNTTQRAWLKKYNLVLTVDSDGTLEVRPEGASVFVCDYFFIRQWGGKGQFEVHHAYLATQYYPAPASKVVGRHTSLKEALRNVVRF